MKSETIREASRERSRHTVPTLSVCMTNYNHARFLPTALDGLLGQADFVTELLVLDDASSDESWEVLEDYASRFDKLRIFRNSRNRGVIANINHLLELSTGEYWYGAAADDLVLPGFLQRSLSLLAEYPQVGLCSTLTRVMNEDGVDEGIRFGSPFRSSEPRRLTPAEVLREFTRRGSWIQGNTTIYKREALVAAGGFREELGPYCDGFAQKVIALTHGVGFLPDPLAAWRRTGANYASGAFSDLEAAETIRRNAVRLMEGEFRDLFPPDYVERFSQRWRYMTWSASRSRSRDELTRAVGVLFDGGGLASAVGGRTVAAAVRGGLAVAQLLAGVSLRSRDLAPMLGRLRFLAARSSARPPRGLEIPIERGGD